MRQSFDWDDLKYFLAVARNRRLVTAAKALNQSHMTVSRRITGLESTLGTTLYHKNEEGYSLTEDGKRLLPIAENVERLAKAVSGEIGGRDGWVGGTVLIEAPDDFAGYFLAPRLAGLCHQYPDLKIELATPPRRPDPGPSMADIALTAGRPTQGRLVARRLATCRMGLFASRAYLDRAAAILTPVDLSAHTLIENANSLFDWARVDAGNVSLPAMPVTMRTSSIVAQMQAVLAGGGLCVLPSFVAAAEPELQPILPAEIGMSASLWLSFADNARRISRIRKAVDFIAAEISSARALFGGEAAAQ